MQCLSRYDRALFDDADNAARWLDPPEVEVVIEVPRGSFLKRGSTGHVDFISPLPCPFNYGAVPMLVGLEGDLLDAVVLGPRLAVGSRVRLPAWGAIVAAGPRHGGPQARLQCEAGR